MTRLLLCLLLTGCAPCIPKDSWVCSGNSGPGPVSDPEPWGTRWTATQYGLAALNVSCIAADAWQTRWSLDHGYTEANPIMGDNPSDDKISAATGVRIGAVFLIGANTDEHRTMALSLAMVPCLYAVGHNYSIGVRP